MKKIFIIFLFFTQASWAQAIEGEVELGGWVLGQYRRVVHAQLGPPMERRVTKDKWVYEFHALKPDTSVYALFKYAHWDTTRIYAVQINGDRYDEMHPFKGLKLGAKKDMVNRALGNFDRSETVDDPPVVIQYYPHKNYSVEIDDTGHLFGIQIFGNILSNKTKDEVPHVLNFRNAVISKNIDSLVLHLSPDIEIYKDGKVIAYTGAARDEFKKKDSELVKYLLGEAGSVWYVFAKEMAEGTSEQRLHQETKEAVVVDKFFDSNVISEVVFKAHAGRWKVYEIKFR